MEGIIPEVKKSGKVQSAKTPARRVRGKLFKKEQKVMVKQHKDIAGMMANPPTKEATKHERTVAKEGERHEHLNEEREERLERLRRRKIEWQGRKAKLQLEKAATIMNVKVVEEECKTAKVPVTIEHDEIVSQEAHTPCPGPIKKKNRKDMQCIMTVVHTPLLGPATVHYSGAKPPVCLNSGAGVKTYKNGQSKEDVRQ